MMAPSNVIKCDKARLLSFKPLALLLIATAWTASGQQQQKQLEKVFNFNDPTEYFASDSVRDKLDEKLTFDQYVTYSINSIAQVAGYDNDLHRYDSKQDLLNSFEHATSQSAWLTGERHEVSARFGRQLNGRRQQRADSSELELFSDQSELAVLENDLTQQECSKQLDQLIDMSLKLFRNFDSYSTSRQLGLMDFIDSYGSAPSEQLLMGNHLWLGAHEQCSLARVNSTTIAMQPIRGRYCVAKLRSPNWPQPENGGGDDQQPPISGMPAQMRGIGDLSIRLGVCLPRACNSISILRHSNKLETLIKIVRLHQVPFSSYKLQGIFCLPDETSPLRQLSPSARTFLACLTGWFTLVLYFSLKYERLQVTSDGGVALDERQLSKWIKVFAFRYAWQALFADSAPTGQMLNKQSAKQDGESTSRAACNDNIRQTQPMMLDKTNNAREVTQKRTNLAAIDGIKVLSMIWLISAHTMLFFLRTISNGRDFWSLIMEPRFLTIMAGIFPVDTFFTVTGVLTSYLKFNKDDGRAMQRSSYWLEAFVHRYLRFMPMYLVIFWYTRDVSEYIGQGPLWDYATANTSLRSMCKQESVVVPLLFQANFKPLDQHCVKPAWYLANDYQYLLITPIYIALLMCSRWLGYLAIMGSILASLVAQFYTVYTEQQFTDFAGLINFRPMFATYVLKDLWKLYTLPYNRIGPYLLGLLTGHLMYRRAREFAKRTSTDGKSAAKKGSGLKEEETMDFEQKRVDVHHRGLGVTTPMSKLHTSYASQHPKQQQCECGEQNLVISSGRSNNNASIDYHQLSHHQNLAQHQHCPLQHMFNSQLQVLPLAPNQIDANGSGNGASAALIPQLFVGRVVALEPNQYISGQTKPLETRAHPTKPIPLERSMSSHPSLSTKSTSDRQGDRKSPMTESMISANDKTREPVEVGKQNKAIMNNDGTPKPSSICLSSFLRQYLCIRVWTPLMLLISIIYLPLLTKLFTHEGERARIGASLIIALMRFFWSIAIARLIFVCCCSSHRQRRSEAHTDIVKDERVVPETDTIPVSSCHDAGLVDMHQRRRLSDSFIISFLESKLWKPWSKIGLSVLLIQWEIIGYLAQMQAAPPYMSISYMLGFVLISIVTSYAIGLLVYLTIEFPLSQFENYFIHPKFFAQKR